MEAIKRSEELEFYRSIEKGVSLLDFNSPWCAPCRAQGPIMQKLAKKYGGKVMVAPINIDEHEQPVEKRDVIIIGAGPAGRVICSMPAKAVYRLA